MEKATIAEVMKLEGENSKLKKQLVEVTPNAVGHDALRTLRAISLRGENKFLRQLLIDIGKVPVV